MDPRFDLYRAVIGPNGNGDVTHRLRVYVPTRDPVLIVKAWAGETEPICTFVKNSGAATTSDDNDNTTTKVDHKSALVNQAEEAGCVFVRVRPDATPTQKR
jgi:hypothetical protein